MSETTLRMQIRDFMDCVEAYCQEARDLSSAGPDWNRRHWLTYTWEEWKKNVLSDGNRLAERLVAGRYPIERLTAFLKVIELDGVKEPPLGDYPAWDEAKVWLWQLRAQVEQAEGTGAGHNPAEVEQAEGSDEKTRQEKIANLRSAVRKAYLSFDAARLKAERKDMEDWEAYKLLKEEGIPEDGQGELADYQLPAEETWSRYLRQARQALGEQKYTPRRGRQYGKSIVRQDQIEPPDNDDE